MKDFLALNVGNFFQVWNEGTSGTEGGIRLYLREIIPLLTSALESPQWRFVFRCILVFNSDNGSEKFVSCHFGSFRDSKQERGAERPTAYSNECPHSGGIVRTLERDLQQLK